MLTLLFQSHLPHSTWLISFLYSTKKNRFSMESMEKTSRWSLQPLKLQQNMRERNMLFKFCFSLHEKLIALKEFELVHRPFHCQTVTLLLQKSFFSAVTALKNIYSGKKMILLRLIIYLTDWAESSLDIFSSSYFYPHYRPNLWYLSSLVWPPNWTRWTNSILVRASWM